MIERSGLFIGGEWRKPSGEGRIEVDEAATGTIIGTVPAGDETDAEAAIAAARSAFTSWSMTPLDERVALVSKIGAALRKREDELARIMAQEVGTPMAIARRVQVGLAATVFDTTAEAATSMEFEQRVGTSLVCRVPVGVVGAITPWNYPLYQLAAKVAPALVAGCTIVVKPSSVAPLATFVLAEELAELGLPPGVFNLVSGRGSRVGEVLASHPDIDMVSITGSTGAGVRVAEVAAGTVKRVSLELGGKSPFLLLEGADVESAVANALRGCFVNNGQTCAATTRLLVPSSLLDDVEERVAAAIDEFVIGDPLDDTTTMGPVASAAQAKTVAEYIESGAQDGVVIAGGPGPVPELDPRLVNGYFVRPTAVSRLSPEATVVREEVFGPVLSILSYDGVEEGIALANDSDYGLSGAVFGADMTEAVSVARRLRTGQVSINGGRFNARAPFGGFKASGVGRELGEFGIHDYVELLSLQLPSADDVDSLGPVV
jgi:aldehyde dehydrogenase (NAD+)